jgi:hypothetical protein
MRSKLWDNRSSPAKSARTCLNPRTRLLSSAHTHLRDPMGRRSKISASRPVTQCCLAILQSPQRQVLKRKSPAHCRTNTGHTLPIRPMSSTLRGTVFASSTPRTCHTPHTDHTRSRHQTPQWNHTHLHQYSASQQPRHMLHYHHHRRQHLQRHQQLKHHQQLHQDPRYRLRYRHQHSTILLQCSVARAAS